MSTVEAASAAPVDKTADSVALSSLALEVGLPADIAEALWAALGLVPANDLAVAAAIPEGILNEDLQKLRKKLDYPTATAGRIAMAALAPAPKPAPAALQEHAAYVRRGQTNLVLDQYDNAPFDLLTDTQRAACRANHKQITGGKAPTGKQPSSEQLASLSSRLSRGEAPYADFAVFVPHGVRFAKKNKFNAQVFINGQLETKWLNGPSSFKLWKESWAVFRAAMISLSAAAPASLDGYLEGIAQLVEMYPNYWGGYLLRR
jgi:hypothetical protein